MDTRTVKKYLHSPVVPAVHKPRPSKIDPFKPLLAELLEQDPCARGSVILQRLQTAPPVASIVRQGARGTVRFATALLLFHLFSGFARKYTRSASSRSVAMGLPPTKAHEERGVAQTLVCMSAPPATA
jgi:hypothetical protein